MRDEPADDTCTAAECVSGLTGAALTEVARARASTAADCGILVSREKLRQHPWSPTNLDEHVYGCSDWDRAVVASNCASSKDLAECGWMAFACYDLLSYYIPSAFEFTCNLRCEILNVLYLISCTRCPGLHDQVLTQTNYTVFSPAGLNATHLYIFPMSNIDSVSVRNVCQYAEKST